MSIFMGHVTVIPNKGDGRLSGVVRGAWARCVCWETGDNKQSELSEEFISFSREAHGVLEEP